MTSKKYKTFKEFYPFYLTEHSDATCRGLHFVGTTLFFIFLILGIATLRWEYFVLMPVAGYGFAWVGGKLQLSHVVYDLPVPISCQAAPFAVLEPVR